jgi:transforming growth factor-beta-induced protein
MKRILAALVACCAIAAIPVASATAHRSAKMSEPNIVTLAASNPQLSTLVKLVKSAGLVKALSGSAKLTVFAPTNAAFAKVPKATLNTLAHNTKLLAKVLEYHVVKGALTAAQIEKKHSLKTLEGASLTVKVKDGSVYINQAKVIKANVLASNGIVHVINGVLTPPKSSPSENIVQVAASAPQFSTLVSLVKQAGLVKALSGTAKLTLFAPTNAAFSALQHQDPKLFAKVAHSRTLLKDVLLYHVVAGALDAKQVVAHKSLPTLLGQNLKIAVRSAKVFVNQAQVIKANIAASNGVIHAINSVLLPRLPSGSPSFTG